MAQRISGIYAIVNTANGKRYIGSWIRDVPPGQLQVEEQREIDSTPNRYNIAKFAYSPGKAMPLNAHQKATLLECNRRRVYTPEMRKRLSDMQKNRSPESREKQRLARLGTKNTAESNAKRSATLKARGGTCPFGWHQPPTAREIIRSASLEMHRKRRAARLVALLANSTSPRSEWLHLHKNPLNRRTYFSHGPLGLPARAIAKATKKLALVKRCTGRKPSAQTIEKIRLSNTGRQHSAETRAKMSAARKGRKYNAETRRKISEAAKRRGMPRATINAARDANRGRTRSRRETSHVTVA
jgi:hypothetical protein